MNYRFFSFLAAAALVIVSIYALSSPLSVFVEARKTVTDIWCHSQDNGKTRCCGDEVDDKLVYGYTGVTYCTTCDDTNPPTNCTPREKIEKTAKPGSDVLNALKGSKGLNVNSPSFTTDNTKIPKNFTSKTNELVKDGANTETNNPLPSGGNDTSK